jgi:hypothetical protein
MERYYPGGWCVAWRSPGDSTRIRADCRIPGGLLEAVGHNVFPEIDPDSDTLTISEEWKRVTVSTLCGPGWEGVEIRMAHRSDLLLDLTADGRPLHARVGEGRTETGLPARISPDRARAGRRKLDRLFRGEDIECVVFWVEPGSEPTAKRQKQQELRRQLRSIGYIE